MGSRGFLLQFLSLAALSGTTLGMSKLITTFYALGLGASAAQIGYISAAEALGMVVLTLPAGLLIDRLGSKKLYVFASLLPAALHVAILCWSNWLWLAALRFLIGVCVPFRSVAMSGLFLQRLPQLGLNKAGWFRGSLMIGMLLAGPWLGGWLYEHFGPLAFLWVALSFAGMAFWGRNLWNQEHKLNSRTDRTNNLRTLFNEPTLRICCLIEGLSSATSSLFATFILILCVEQLHWTQTQAVKLVAAQGLVTVLCLFLLSHKFSRIAPQRIYTLSLAAACIALCLLGWLESFVGLAMIALLLSTASSATHLANIGQLTKLSLDKGGVSGLFSLAQTLGMFCGSLFGGILSHWLDMRQLFPVWSVVVLFGAGLIYILSKNKIK